MDELRNKISTLFHCHQRYDAYGFPFSFELWVDHVNFYRSLFNLPVLSMIDDINTCYHKSVEHLYDADWRSYCICPRCYEWKCSPAYLEFNDKRIDQFIQLSDHPAILCTNPKVASTK